MKKGLLIVVDGTDGSGKTTQIDLLVESLREQEIPYEVISFPRYKDNIYGKLVAKYLEGEFGATSEVNPYLISLAYAGDRYLAKPKIEKWIKMGKVVLANRYVSSSKAHMGANLPERVRRDFFIWLDELEYETNGIPKEDLTILLAVDPKTGQKNVLKKKKPDIHEINTLHLEEAGKIYLELAKQKQNWYVVDCMKGGEMKRRREIHQEIVDILEKKLYDKI